MIIWLASYPKSGNTWVRSMVAALLYSGDGKFNFELIKNIKQFPDKSFFENFTNDFGNFNEIQKYWLRSQELINLDNKTKILKTHHLNCKINNYNFTNSENTLASIYIVRDPRNLLNSISNHYSKTLEESKNFLITPKFIAGYKQNGEFKNNSIKALLGTWGEHYNFWKMKSDNFLLVKYEDLICDTKLELNRIINFLKKFIDIKTSPEKIQNILETTSFNNLQNLEKSGMFNENAYETLNKKKNFFHLGPNNDWKKISNQNLIKEIENKFHKEMKELGYLV